MQISAWSKTYRGNRAELASPQNGLEPGFAPLKNLICSFFFFDLEMVMLCPFSNLKPPTWNGDGPLPVLSQLQAHLWNDSPIKIAIYNW